MVMLFVMLFVLFMQSRLVLSLGVCRQVRENNLKVRLWVQQSDPPKIAPYLASIGEAMAEIGALVVAGKQVHKEDIRECDKSIQHHVGMTNLPTLMMLQVP